MTPTERKLGRAFPSRVFRESGDNVRLNVISDGAASAMCLGDFVAQLHERGGMRSSDSRRARRQAIFIDIENIGSRVVLAAALRQLGCGSSGPSTDVFVFGNLGIVSEQVAQMLIAHGARLIDTNPPPTVKDWTDLALATAAGTWLALASAGDCLGVVSSDRAFDAIGDAAARVGVTYRRLSNRATSNTCEAIAGLGRGARRPRRRVSQR